MNTPLSPGKREDKYDNTHFMDKRTEAQRNANGLLWRIELDGGRVRMTQVSGLLAMYSIFPSQAIY